MKILFASMNARLGMCFINRVSFAFFLHNVTTFAFAFANRRCLFIAFQDKKRAAAADAAPRDGDKALHCRAKRRRVSTDVGSVGVDKGFALYLQGELGMRPVTVANKLRLVGRLWAAMDCGRMDVSSPSTIFATMCRKGAVGILQTMRLAVVGRSFAPRMALTLAQLCDWYVHRAEREGDQDAADLAAVRQLGTDARRCHRDSSSRLWNVCVKEEPSMTLRDVHVDEQFASFVRHREGISSQMVQRRVLCMERFWAAIDCGGNDINSPAAISAIIQKGALDRLQSMRLFSLEKSWTKFTAVALRSWCQWQLTKLESDSSVDGQLRVQLRADIYLAQFAAAHWYKRCRPSLGARSRARKRTDAQRIDRLAGFEVARSAACRAMRDLADLVAAHEGKTHMRASDQVLASSIMCGLVFSLTVAGRSKAWVLMKERWARQQIFATGLDYFEFTDHKTWGSLGDDVCFIPPCIKRAFEEYWKLPLCCPTELALRSPSGKPVWMPTALLNYSKRYLPGDAQAYGVNLLRKYFTKGMYAAAGLSDPVSNRDVVACGMHAHNTAVKDYLALTPPELADIRRRAYISVMGGEPPEWPERDPASRANVSE